MGFVLLCKMSIPTAAGFSEGSLELLSKRAGKIWARRFYWWILNAHD